MSLSSSQDNLDYQHAVVIGGSMAGLLATRVLSDHFKEVTIIERDRLSEGVEHATFLAGDIREAVLERDFDAVVGRNILMYVANPAEVLRLCASHLRPGGIVAFQEVEWSLTEQVDGMSALLPLVQQAASWIVGGFRQAGAEMQMGFKFPRIFLDAGLPFPHMSLDGIVGTEADWVGYDFLTDVLRDILPKLYEYGILKEQLDAATYVARLREEIRQRHALFPLFFLAGAWAQKG